MAAHHLADITVGTAVSSLVCVWF